MAGGKREATGEKCSQCEYPEEMLSFSKDLFMPGNRDNLFPFIRCAVKPHPSIRTGRMSKDEATPIDGIHTKCIKKCGT